MFSMIRNQNIQLKTFQASLNLFNRVLSFAKKAEDKDSWINKMINSFKQFLWEIECSEILVDAHDVNLSLISIAEIDQKISKLIIKGFIAIRVTYLDLKLLQRMFSMMSKTTGGHNGLKHVDTCIVLIAFLNRIFCTFLQTNQNRSYFEA